MCIFMYTVVVNWFPHLSIAKAPNNSLPASAELRKCTHMVMRGSLKCHRLLIAITLSPSNGEPGKSLALLRISVSTLDLDLAKSLT